MRAVIRWVDEDNAHTLGYFGYGKVPTWVLETGDGEWETDLTGIPETRVDVAQREAEAVLGSAPAFWRSLPGNYGTAYETELEAR